ncbi:hypothetical protein CROQUDRAFT_595352 [Cronartium quercuum f. sp. fusiforme G11]|uniref:Metallo-beta-lactamase domain-containing protein n=1 Tax=Cronartium quercuum f. sp. fusiforme G11 TaxID=708437 RepID=A0A9P6NFZ8_9BASI|nr:hypothetical protein CROQUDRAFT_595352 [Cronartium quercuum f. sp. fusiforme G11]
MRLNLRTSPVCRRLLSRARPVMSLQTDRQVLSLPSFPSVTKLSPTVTRILGQNPGPYTLQGTNTYLIAGTDSSILLDTAQGLPAYAPLLESVLRVNPPVSDIILTHWHQDHVHGLPSALEVIRATNLCSPSSAKVKKPKVWKHKIPHQSPDKLDERDLELDKICSGATEAKVEFSPQNGALEPTDNRSINWLKDGQAFRVSQQHHLRILHTPGHTDDSISCLLYDGSQALEAIFAGDTVLGGRTSIFENLSAYLHSLQSLRQLLRTSTAVRIYPGHGEVIEDGQAEIDRYLINRRQRDEQILAILASDQLLGPFTTELLAGCIYKNSLPDQVMPAALRGLRLHLNKLVEEGRVREIVSDQWVLIPSSESF